jgi:O-antigen ligase
VTAETGRALQVTRAAAIGVAVGAVVTPPLANIAAGVMLIAFFFVPDWRERARRTGASRLGKGVLVLLVALLLATVLGAFGPQGPSKAFVHLLGWRTLGVLLIGFAVFDTGHAKVRLMQVFIAIAAVAGLVSLGSILTNTPITRMPIGVVLRNTVTQAMAFGIAAFFAVILLVTRRTAVWWERVLLGFTVVLMLGLLLFLQVGRSGQVMFAILLVVAALRVLRGPRRVAAVAAVPVLAALAFVVSPMMQARFSLAWEEVIHAASATEYSSMGIRVVMWQNSVELVRARPLIGYGMGGLEPAYAARMKDEPPSWKSIVTGDPHNQFLALWIEGGVVALLAFVFFLVCVARQPAPEPWRSVALSLLVAWCATSMVSSHFQTFNEGHLIALFLGVFLAPVGRAEEARQVRIA